MRTSAAGFGPAVANIAQVALHGDRATQMEDSMNTARTLAIAALAMASLPLLAQQPSSTGQQPTTSEPTTAAPASPAQTQQQMAPPSSAATAASAPAELSPVNGELVDKLDTKTAKTGDAVVIKTKSNVKTADGTDIPKGSKLVGKVTGVKPIGEGNENSQVALQFDHIELKGGQSVPIHAELQSLSTTEGDTTASAETASPSPSPSPSAGSASPSGGMSGSGSATATPATSQPQMSNGAASASPAAPAAGTIVARTGNIAIRTTSIPGVLLATNEPGQQDPRLAQSSGILLGPKHDVHLDSGTKVVIGVAAAGAANPGGGN
jgi:hypothetical protein